MITQLKEKRTFLIFKNILVTGFRGQQESSQKS